ncbi:hypothetical protein CRV08_07975 [Halarcobacter ebronensis]|uniref:Transposase n=1 Tax=Halarcobacter ebronensis TaxID=1462615 RepID=A0A4Q0YEW3_9BACT|nr:hypothetical protein [Halarcobacter ebronensis]RXJ68184.1 hypothetical protein CRV08_07975 [Halarcobacter ebronensis]
MICPYCNSKRIYHLKDENKKCSVCKRKFSPRKIDTDLRVIEFFCNNINANSCANRLKLNYRTVQNRYMLFRKLVAYYLEEQHYSSILDNSSYEEYYYFTNRQKRDKKRSLYEAVNIIGFYSNRKVFTLLMPKLRRYDRGEDNKSFENYLKWHKIYSQYAYSTPLSVFWKYLEENLKKYKGITEDNFFYYLKECEFKFNYLQNMQIEIIKKLYFK